MSGPTTRVLTVLELLQAHGQLGGGELAQRLGVNRRTVRRYIRILEDLGIPVMTEQGRYGGYRLVAGFKLPPMMFTNEETLAISLGLLSAKQLGLTDAAPAIASVQAKLERVMPDKLKGRARAISETARVILPRKEPNLDEHALDTLATATETARSVHFIYHAPQHPEMERNIDPYGLVFRQGRWYVTGFCHLRSAMRSFRLDRISEVQLLADRFTRPADFDAAEFLHQSFMAWNNTHAVSLTFHTDPATLASLFDPGEYCRDGIQQTADGLLMETHVDSFEWFASWLAQLTFAFTIHSPAELKHAVKAHATRLLDSCR
ncbi:helix-turn-helix transcriptional regulator [Marinobacter nauticus]|jgi:predicted DNA-binding transcriptional regulator YafY|uniref:DNA-binding transcriptional regulator YafY n=1 Tax=Marinobacter nauticus TaxID=2743 RepID=A0A368V942_MARNT|nr:YafY family protein [Marinobacter nauticus]RBP76891.1 putative DNA-binding transcriptional regulator YafY [Marinobacter nauticus]RCW37737.1 putative DNA-binding transcriptional regulator YafY [Marinobacter nauticus]TPW23443.1 YafY family transcriptional regulator [Marinobacter nauticus]